MGFRIRASANSSPPLDIAALAKARLQASDYYSIRIIDCEFDDGSLLLRGSLPTFYHKQLAQQAVTDIVGVEHVVNQIRVLD